MSRLEGSKATSASMLTVASAKQESYHRLKQWIALANNQY